MNEMEIVLKLTQNLALKVEGGFLSLLTSQLFWQH